MKRPCVYCGAEDGSTLDHIPPRGFFPESVSSDVNLITVPCCESCRLKDQRDDEFIRNIFVSLQQTEDHPTIAQDVSKRRDRSFMRDPSQLLRLADIMKQVDVVTPTGIYVGRGFAMNLDDPRMHRFVERVSRAVLHDAHGEAYFPTNCSWKANLPFIDHVLKLAPPEIKRKTVSDVFAYFSPRLDQAGIYWVVLVFYERLLIVARLAKAVPPIHAQKD
jgi:hypothetical protein